MFRSCQTVEIGITMKSFQTMAMEKNNGIGGRNNNSVENFFCDVYYINVSCFHSSDKHTDYNESKYNHSFVGPKTKDIKVHLMEESKRGALCLQLA